MMTKLKILTVCACFLMAIIVFVPYANATLTTVSFSSTGVGPLTFNADTFSLSGILPGGTLALDDMSSVTRGVNNATFTVDYGLAGTKDLTLSYDLTVAGVTHTVSQSAVWTITDPADNFVTVAASAPVLFVTGAGSWEVTLDAYAFPFITLPGSMTLSTPAIFTPVPEPASMMLFGTGLIAMGGVIRNGRKRSGSS
jgi:hypothetical protein